MNPPAPRLSTLDSRLIALLGGAMVCLWLLLCVLLGATDLRQELHDLGLD